MTKIVNRNVIPVVVVLCRMDMGWDQFLPLFASSPTKLQRDHLQLGILLAVVVGADANNGKKADSISTSLFLNHLLLISTAQKAKAAPDFGAAL